MRKTHRRREVRTTHLRSAANRWSIVRTGAAAAAHTTPRCATESPTPSDRRQTTVRVVFLAVAAQSSATASATPSSRAESLSSVINVRETSTAVAVAPRAESEAASMSSAHDADGMGDGEANAGLLSKVCGGGGVEALLREKQKVVVVEVITE